MLGARRAALARAGKPLHIHRILLQRSWIAIFCGRFRRGGRDDRAGTRTAWTPRRGSSWLQYARLDDHLGNILARRGAGRSRFDGGAATTGAAEARYQRAAGLTRVDRRRPRGDAELDAPRNSRCPPHWPSTRCATRSSTPRRERSGHVRVRADSGGRIRRRMGVGEHRTPQPTGRISQRPRNVQHRAVGQRHRRMDREPRRRPFPSTPTTSYALVAAGSARWPSRAD